MAHGPSEAGTSIHQDGAYIPLSELPRVDVPTPEALLKARAKFGEVLTQALSAANLTDDTALGKMVAQNQENPSRDGMPYHPAVVAAWKEGRSLPSVVALAALKDTLSGVLRRNQEEALDSAYEAASFNPYAAKRQLTKNLATWLSTPAHKVTPREISLACLKTEIGEEAFAVLDEKKRLKKIGKFRGTFSEHYNVSYDHLEILAQVLRGQFHCAEADIATLQNNYIELQEVVNQQGFQPDEFTVTLAAYIAASGLSQSAIAREIGVEYPTVTYWKHGHYQPTEAQLMALETLLDDRHVTQQPRLSLLHAFIQRDAAEQRWQEAEMEKDFGGLLQACREVLGVYLEEMVAQLATYTGKEKPLTGAALCNWEHNIGLPRPSSLNGQRPEVVYGAILQEADKTMPPEIRENFGNFWNEERAKTMRDAFNAAIHDAQRDGGRGFSKGNGWDIG